MYGHHRDACYGVIGVFVLIGQQTHLMHEVCDACVFTLLSAVFNVLTYTAQQLFQVALTVYTLSRSVGRSIRHHSRLIEYELGELKRIHLLHLLCELLNLLGECLQFTSCGCGYLCGIHLRRLHYAQHRYTLAQSCLTHPRNARIAYAAFGYVHYSLQRLIVAAVCRQTEVCNGILYFLALIERHSAINAVRDTEFAHLFLKVSALCVRAVQDGYLFIVAMVELMHTQDLLGNSCTLLAVAAVAGQLQPFADFFFRIDLFVYLSFVLVNKAVGGIDDILGRAVVTLQFEQFGTRVAVLEREDILNRSPAKTVYTLCIITHHAYMVLRFSQQFDNQVLCVVGILVLIHQHVPEPLLVALTHLGVVVQ